jgi:hypothetical protein
MFAIGANILFVHRRVATLPQPSARPEAVFEQLIRTEPDAGSAAALLEAYAPDGPSSPGRTAAQTGGTATDGGSAPAAVPKADGGKKASRSRSARSRAAEGARPAVEDPHPDARAAATTEPSGSKPKIWRSKRKPPEEEEEEVQGWVIRR